MIVRNATAAERLAPIVEPMILDAAWRICRDQIFTSSGDRLFNPYRDEDLTLDRPGAASIRRENLRRYLATYAELPPVLLVAEAPGPWGCRFTGVPITSEAQLLNPEFPLSGASSSSAAEPHSEYSAAIFWRIMAPYFPRFLVWNAVPLHPFKSGEPMSIRTPTIGELIQFAPSLRELTDVVSPRFVVAVGRRAELLLGRIGVECTYIRHPSQGGARLFEDGIRSVMDRSRRF